MNPIHARYQTALRPDVHNQIYYSKQTWFCKAISLCSGDFIALSDQDDIWEDWKIEKQINSIKDFDLIFA